MKVNFLFGKAESALEDLAAVKAAGFDFAEDSVPSALMPDQGAEAWAVQKQKLLEGQKILPYRSLNGFLPRTFKLTGPNPTTEAALAYAETACRRADEVGIPFLVLGSSAARSVPEGYDLEAGKAQFIAFCRELCRRIADCKVRVLLENLQRKESNILNSLKDSLAVMKAVDSPRLQLMADCFHMYQVGDSPKLLKEIGEHLFHIHFADPETRSLPGFSKSTFLPECMKVLAEMNYQGAISMECSWIEKNSSFEESWRDGLRVVHQWMAEC